jgi:taurine dioxygenase
LKKTYELHPNRIGCLVTGIDLKSAINADVIKQIIDDVTTHKLLVFKNQGIVSAERQLEIGKWFGKIESTFYNHPKSPHRDVFRVSNDPEEGCTNVGRTGWHIDGSFQEKPFSHSIYHIIDCPSDGATVFANLNELIECLDEEKKTLWDRLYMASDRRGGVTHPHMYPHPLTGKSTLCFHLGMTDHYILDYGTSKVRILNIFTFY